VKSGRYLLLGMYYPAPTFDMGVARALAAWSHRLAGDTTEQRDHMTTDVASHRLPPPGHPETLAQGVPLSPCERELWADALDQRYSAGQPSGFRWRLRRWRKPDQARQRR
jgi:hypothetical protein